MLKMALSLRPSLLSIPMMQVGTICCHSRFQHQKGKFYLSVKHIPKPRKKLGSGMEPKRKIIPTTSTGRTDAFIWGTWTSMKTLINFVTSLDMLTTPCHNVLPVAAGSSDREPNASLYIFASCEILTLGKDSEENSCRNGRFSKEYRGSSKVVRYLRKAILL